MTAPCRMLDELAANWDDEAAFTLEQHAAGCPACAAELADWDRISRGARELRMEWESPSLWPRIERAIELAASRHGSAMRFERVSLVFRIAATLLLVAALAIVAGRVARPAAPSTDEAMFAGWVLRQSAIDEVERAEKAHLASIERLSNLAAPALERADSPLIAAYREQLMLLDDAIAECRSEIERNRYNAHLRHQLLAVVQEKDRTLRELLEETDVQ